ncbi:MAG: anthranilate phosphoribosyltransferase [Candidatus Omnitrophota bacterium]|nr:MAG: anthranilate phosphoribosyltransferase [Candidatus Omnitrophota bacterium]
MIKEAISKLVERSNLSFQETEKVFEEMFEKKATGPQIAAFLISLKIKGETEEEISAAAKVIRERAKKMDIRERFLGLEQDDYIVDTCGTGGSGINKFNISTAVAVLVSAAGIKVAKHGNRAMSSSCGSADVLEELGVKIDVPSSIMEEAIKRVGIGFLYAPLYHPALAEVAQIRRQMGIRTIFNILGPLCNPAYASHQLLGVYAKSLVPIMARALRYLGIKKAFVVHSNDLKDEVSLGGPTYVSFLNNRKITNLSLKPSDFGLKRVYPKALHVRDVKESAELIQDIFGGKRGGPRDVVLANASCCFYILGKAKSLKNGVQLAAHLIDEGKAKKKLSQFKKFLESNQCAENNA